MAYEALLRPVALELRCVVDAYARDCDDDQRDRRRQHRPPQLIRPVVTNMLRKLIWYDG